MSSWDYPPQQKKDFPNTHQQSQTNTNIFSAQQLQLLWYPSIGVCNGTDPLVLLLWICRIRKRIAPNLCHNKNAKRIQHKTLSCILLFMGRGGGLTWCASWGVTEGWGDKVVGSEASSSARLRPIRSVFSFCNWVCSCATFIEEPPAPKKTSKLRDHHGLITVDCSGLGK
jgi:hypothetical protein